MRNISIDDINAAILNGGAGSLLVRVELEPASGLDGIIAPAKYAGANNATYVYEKRYLGEEKPQKVVLIDSKGSFANRVEETITEARRTGEGLLASMPHIVVKYNGSGKGSIIGLGAIPPSADKGALDGVSVRGIVSSRVLSFTMLRTFHFGKGVEGDAAIRALIAAALLRAMAGYDENPVVRANCALTETGKPLVVLNKRYGEKEEFEPLTAESTEKLLEEAYTQAREKAGIVWNNDYVPKETEGLAGYRPPFVHSERALEAPWTRAIVMSVTVDEGHQSEKSEWKPSESEYVGWTVALHRFLVKQWGVDPAPSLVGKYVSGIKRPANNVAIQILDSELKSSYGIQLSDDVARKLPGFLIMLPKDMPQHDMQKLYDVCKRSNGKTLYFSQAVPKLRLGESALIDAEHLWKPVSVDFVRYWMPRPLAIAETRPIPDPKKKRHWRAAESMYLALGHVWRDKYVPNDIQGTRESRYWETVDAVADQSSNFRIFDCRRVSRVNMIDYAHHTNSSNVLRAMSALIAISDGEGSLDCAALAVGQSRHLGGGFLVPLDFPKNMIVPDGHFEKGVPSWLK